MALYNFQKYFAPAILSGTKRHTIRATRVRRTRVGEMCHLYTGLRQKGATLLGRYECSRVEEIEITADGRVIVDGIELSCDEKEALAVRDGFRLGFAHMLRFWRGRLPFKGQIIHWRYLKGGGHESA